LEATPKFYQSEFDEEENKGFGFGLLSQYVLRCKSFLMQLSVGLLASSLLQLFFLSGSQSIVDVGIQN
jgi:ATP-binding cassette subfamily B protein